MYVCVRWMLYLYLYPVSCICLCALLWLIRSLWESFVCFSLSILAYPLAPLFLSWLPINFRWCVFHFNAICGSTICMAYFAASRNLHSHRPIMAIYAHTHTHNQTLVREWHNCFVSSISKLMFYGLLHVAYGEMQRISRAWKSKLQIHYWWCKQQLLLGYKLFQNSPINFIYIMEI